MNDDQQAGQLNVQGPQPQPTPQDSQAQEGEFQIQPRQDQPATNQAAPVQQTQQAPGQTPAPALEDHPNVESLLDASAEELQPYDEVVPVDESPAPQEKASKPFVDRVMTISPVYNDAYGTGIPGMQGAGGAVAGASNSGSDAVRQLQRAVLAFGMSYEARPRDMHAVHRLADEVEQNIRNIQVLNVITPEDAERLIDELVDLIQGVH